MVHEYSSVCDVSVAINSQIGSDRKWSCRSQTSLRQTPCPGLPGWASAARSSPGWVLPPVVTPLPRVRTGGSSKRRTLTVGQTPILNTNSRHLNITRSGKRNMGSPRLNTSSHPCRPVRLGRCRPAAGSRRMHSQLRRPMAPSRGMHRQRRRPTTPRPRSSRAWVLLLERPVAMALHRARMALGRRRSKEQPIITPTVRRRRHSPMQRSRKAKLQLFPTRTTRLHQCQHRLPRVAVRMAALILFLLLLFHLFPPPPPPRPPILHRRSLLHRKVVTQGTSTVSVAHARCCLRSVYYSARGIIISYVGYFVLYCGCEFVYRDYPYK